MGERKKIIIVPRATRKIEDLQPMVRKTIRESIDIL